MAETFAAGFDLGTAFLQCARDTKDGKSIAITESRNCYRTIDYTEEFEDQLKQQKCHFIKDGDKIHILGNQAYVQAGMAEFGACQRGETDILQRPMKDGILNADSPKVSLSILRELTKACIQNEIGEARNGEILYYSIPANPIDSKINNTFHQMSTQKYFESLGFDARPLNEALSICFAENPKMYTPEGEIPFTGVSCSFGAGQANVCLSERGVPVDEFSIARSGDWIDQQVATMTGQPKTKVIRIKEKGLDLMNIDESNEIELALECYYQELINYVFGLIAKRFKGNKGSIDYPIDIILSGGTAAPKCFDKKVAQIIKKIQLPFEVKNIKVAGTVDGKVDVKRLLQTVARGCYIRAKQAANKANKAS